MEHAYQRMYEKLYDYYGPQNWWPAETTFEMMIGAILVQNTNWRNVDKALHHLRPYLEPETMYRMPVEELAELIRSSGFFNIKAKRIKAFLGWFKDYHFEMDRMKRVDKSKLRRELLTINGIGRETADVMLLYACDKPIFVVDAYARRIFYRIGFNMPKTYDAFRKKVEENVSGDLRLYNEFHALIVEHAKTHCKHTPICEGCPLVAICDRRLE
ncbi:endonuclease III domain-containing protein [Virgibacillus sp. NKC19-3]|uniref:endonuclease III domain-containing protein n=1 Tax=Virgibacillus saliphilus TaxID=2831674 RepID=UPI001C9AC5A8|nr:endonuclease III domain-containing protein [Virgibacillus sp. NKC19-3]MBY7145034.1 endonuclease III domain-containing protein [Virgibacillus sp. NKC19-3]